ncbi:hypothetical protein LTR08_002326 [Meristemomyces frigidus]|nr:hypothetical protein LTR08_002326 [Meristemomyces frigidus]
MATTALTRSTGPKPFNTTPRSREDRPTKRKKEQRTDIWSNLLRQTREAQARSRTQAVQHRELLVCGGSPDDQRAFVQSLARPPPPAPPSRNRDQQRSQKTRGEVRLSNRYAYGYGHVTLYSPPQQTGGMGMLGADGEEVAGVEVHTLPEPDGAYEQIVRRLLEVKPQEDSGADLEDEMDSEEAEKEDRKPPAVALLLSWKEPWRFLGLLRQWLQLLAQALLPAGSSPEDPVEVLKEHKLSLTIIVQHVEAQEVLEREGYKEESFDYISQCLRTCLLPLSAALAYTSSNPPPQQPGSVLSEVQKVLFTSLGLDLGSLSPTPVKTTTPTKKEPLVPKHNVVDRMAIVVPSGWDSVGKIRLLSETFSPEAVLEAWTKDLHAALRPLKQSGSGDPKGEETPKDEQQANGGAEQHAEQAVYATSDIDEDDELASRTLPSSTHPRSAIMSYEQAILDPNAHKLAKPPQIEVTTKPEQQFLAGMRTHLQELETHDAERARSHPVNISTTAGALGSGRALGLPSGEQTGALSDLGDVSFNVGGVSYNTVAAEAAIKQLKQRQQNPSGSGGESPLSVTPRNMTPRPPRREDREVSVGTPQPPSTGTGKGDLPVEKLEEYFASLMKKGGGASAGGTPSKPH